MYLYTFFFSNKKKKNQPFLFNLLNVDDPKLEIPMRPLTISHPTKGFITLLNGET